MVVVEQSIWFRKRHQVQQVLPRSLRFRLEATFFRSTTNSRLNSAYFWLTTIGSLQSIQPNLLTIISPYWFIIKLIILYHKSMVYFCFSENKENPSSFPLGLSSLFQNFLCFRVIGFTVFPAFHQSWWSVILDGINLLRKFVNCGSQPNSSLPRNWCERKSWPSI